MPAPTCPQCAVCLSSSSRCWCRRQLVRNCLAGPPESLRRFHECDRRAAFPFAVLPLLLHRARQRHAARGRGRLKAHGSSTQSGSCLGHQCSAPSKTQAAEYVQEQGEWAAHRKRSGESCKAQGSPGGESCKAKGQGSGSSSSCSNMPIGSSGSAGPPTEAPIGKAGKRKAPRPPPYAPPGHIRRSI